MSRPPPTAAVGGAWKNFTLGSSKHPGASPPPPPRAGHVGVRRGRRGSRPHLDAFRGESFSLLGTETGEGANWSSLRAAAQRSTDQAIGSLLPKGAGRAERLRGSAKKAPPFFGGWEEALLAANPKTRPSIGTSLSPSSRALPHRRILDLWVTPGSKPAIAVEESKVAEFLSSHCHLLFKYPTHLSERRSLLAWQSEL